MNKRIFIVEEKEVAYMCAPGIPRTCSVRSLRGQRPDIIEQVVSDYFKLSLNDIKKKDRRRRFVTCRQIIMMFQRQYTNLSLKDIADRFNCDHTTVIHSIQSAKNFIQTEEEYRINVRNIEIIIK